MQTMCLELHTPARDAVRAGRSTYGFDSIELSDMQVSQIPQDLRDELAHWVELAEQDDSPNGFDPACCLRLETPDVTVANIVVALRRERSARREAEAKSWLAKADEAWIDDLAFDVCVRPEVLALSDLEAISSRLPRVQAKIAEMDAANRARWEAGDRAAAGLKVYAQHISEYARAAKEGYDVGAAAFEHFVNAIAAFDRDAVVLVKGSEELKRSKLEERKAPNQHAFDVLDAVTAHLKKLPSPDGVDVEVGRIQRYRRAVVDKGKWKLDVPVTVVMVSASAYFTEDRVILFFADAEEKKQNFTDDADIPF